MDDFIFPFFVYEDKTVLEKSLSTGHMNKSKIHIDRIDKLLEQVDKLGISHILLFGVPKKRNINGNYASIKNGVIQRSLRLIKGNFGNRFSIFSDVCLCQYNLSGHCGIPMSTPTEKNSDHRTETRIDNDKTLKMLGEVALSHCEGGVDFVAPSAMMDGQVSYIRNLLDSNGFENVRILSYSSKHNSCLYSPFRNSNYLKSGFINKNNYQISFTNIRESLRETLMDIDEGADWVMIKPSMWYMDVIRQTKESIDVPLVIQNVSGEYALMKARLLYENKEAQIGGHIISQELSQIINKKSDSLPLLKQKKNLAGLRSPRLIDDKSQLEVDALLNLMKSYKRAGADKIISYFIMDLFGER